MTPTQRLYELLGHPKIDARPEGAEYHPSGAQWTIEGWKLADESTVLGLLRDAARRVCDVESVRIDWATQSKGVIHTWGVVDGDLEMIADCLDTYESALVAGLEWVIENGDKTC